MSEYSDEKLDIIIELLEKIVKNTDPMNPWGPQDVKSAVENVESEARKIRQHLKDENY